MNASIELFKSDRDLETKGVWVTIEHGVRLLVARMNNPKYLAYLRELMRPHLAQLRPATRRYRKDSVVSMPDSEFDMDGELMDELAAKAMGRHVLLDWDKLSEPKQEDGKAVLDDEDQPVLVEVTYSELKAVEYLSKYREFYLLVLEISNDEAMYKDSTQRESEGN